MKKIFMVYNERASSGFNVEETYQSFGDHSGAVIIVADSLEEARGIHEQETRNYPEPQTVKLAEERATLKEVIINKSGVLLYADGDC